MESSFLVRKLPADDDDRVNGPNSVSVQADTKSNNYEAIKGRIILRIINVDMK